MLMNRSVLSRAPHVRRYGLGTAAMWRCHVARRDRDTGRPGSTRGIAHITDIRDITDGPIDNVKMKITRVQTRGVFQRSANEAHRKNPAHSPIELKKLMESGTATINDKTRCLQHLALDVEQHSPPAHQMERIKDLHLGGTILQWFWRRKAAVRKQISQDEPLFVHMLCWALLAEERENFVWDWLTMECAAASKSPDGAAALVEWSGWASQWLSGVAQAHWRWNPTSAEASLRTLVRAMETFEPVCPSFRTHDEHPLFQRLIHGIRKIVDSPQTMPYDPTLFDFYYDCLPRHQAPEVAAEQQAKSLMFHPTQPDARLMTQLLAENPRSLAAVWSAKRKAMHSFVYYVLRAAYIMRHQGQSHTAEWLDGIVQVRTPKIWNARHHIVKEFDEDAKLASVRTPAECSGSQEQEDA